jgi:hypothetical protein
MLADRIEADLALGEGASLVGELRALLSADPLAGRLGVDPSTQLEQAYLRILRGEEGVPAVVTGAARTSDQTLDAERSVVPAPGQITQLSRAGGNCRT